MRQKEFAPWEILRKPPSFWARGLGRSRSLGTSARCCSRSCRPCSVCHFCDNPDWLSSECRPKAILLCARMPPHFGEVFLDFSERKRGDAMPKITIGILFLLFAAFAVLGTFFCYAGVRALLNTIQPLAVAPEYYASVSIGLAVLILTINFGDYPLDARILAHARYSGVTGRLA